ncbi:MAG: hypothetical protein A2X45_12895 [Lentisphaerae bacterium GWF2_50_93]|nr:MAG: hypothetical protein A2X45_12895 [Lentisphaerae bacterium GWF2_50_93]
MKPKIATLTIERFRALRQLRINGLGQVNLITGRNNTGKSSVLEALRILASDASPSVINNILRYREEDIGEAEDPMRPLDAEGLLQISSLFNGFPQLADKPQPVSISTNGVPRSMTLTLQVAWVSEERDQEGVRKLVSQQQGNLFGEGEGIPALIVEVDGSKRIITLDNFRRYPYRGRPFRSDFGDEPSLPCVFVSPYGGERTATLGALWDNIALSDREKDVVEALKIIDPEISAVSMVGGEGPRQQRTAIVRSSHLPRPVPLRSFGDGLNRLFGIVLSLVNAKGGLLLIDEFENGIHHSVQLDAWRAVFKLSRRLGIQVFATSHSWDSIEAFQKAAAEMPEAGVLVRLSRKGEDIVPTIFAEDELAIATRDRIEVR